MKNTIPPAKSSISLLLVILSLSACTPNHIAPPSGYDHPADVFALEAPLPDSSTTLAESQPVDQPEPIRMMHHGMMHHDM